jgi:hypothetical protein
MFEKIYTLLLRLYPSRFRKEYGDEAVELIRDRLRDETGLLRKTRLCWDLVTDTFVSVPKEYRNSYAVRDAAPLSANGDGAPSFMVLEEEPLGRGSILLGGVLSAAAIFAFALFLSWSSGQLPFPDSHGRISAIEAVVEQLNRPTTPDAGTRGADDAPKPSSAEASEGQPRPRPAEASNPSISHAPLMLPMSKSGADGQKRVIPTPAQVQAQRSGYQRMQPMASVMNRWDGVLTDASGHPVRSAEIHVIGEHGELVALTSGDGSFAFPEIPSGNYEVVVVLAGREVAYLKAFQPRKSSTPARLTLISGGRLMISPPVSAQP